LPGGGILICIDESVSFHQKTKLESTPAAGQSVFDYQQPCSTNETARSFINDYHPIQPSYRATFLAAIGLVRSGVFNGRYAREPAPMGWYKLLHLLMAIARINLS
jgi:hypothetical protein